MKFLPSKSPEFSRFFECLIIQFGLELKELWQQQNIETTSIRPVFFFVLHFVGQGKYVQIRKNSSKHKKYLATRGNLNEVVWSCFGQYLKKEIFSHGEKDESMNESINQSINQWNTRKVG